MRLPYRRSPLHLVRVFEAVPQHIPYPVTRGPKKEKNYGFILFISPFTFSHSTAPKSTEGSLFSFVHFNQEGG